MRHAPSSSPLRRMWNRRWLGCCDECGSAPAGPVAGAEWCTPAWRAIDSRIIWRSSWSFIETDRIDDPDDGGVDRRGLTAERLSGGTALEDDQDLLVNAGAGAINRQQGGAARRV